MLPLRRAIHYGCSDHFKGLVESVVEGPALYDGLERRDLDYLEVFSGQGNLTQCLADAACLNWIPH